MPTPAPAASAAQYGASMLLALAGWIQLLNHSKVVFDHNPVVC
jgi:hypothetical protein